MPFLLTILCAVLGLLAVDHGPTGLVVGGLIGFLLDRSLARQRTLQKQVDALADSLRNLRSAAGQYEAESAPPVQEPIPQEQAPSPSPIPVAPERPATPSPRPDRDPTPARHRGRVPEPARSAVSGVFAKGNTAFARVQGHVRQFLLDGNAFVRVGLLVLFLGLAFLVKFAADNDYLPIEARLAGSALAGLLLCCAGWRLRGKRAEYALALQGGGVAVLYLTVFVAYGVYALIPGDWAFRLLIVIATGGTYLALSQNAQSLAVISMLGGFVAPVLVSRGGGSPVVLFSYFVVLNAAIFSIAFFKSWRGLNLVGFICTFTIAAMWGRLHYTPALYATIEPFLAVFFLSYFGIALLQVRHAGKEWARAIDGSLIFGLPAVAFLLQAGLVRSFPYALAASAVALGFFYVLASGLLLRSRDERYRLQIESFAGIAVTFAILAVPFAFDTVWTGAAWALEGAALFWLGARQRRLLGRVTGVALQVVAGLGFLAEMPGSGAPDPFLNRFYTACVILSFAALFTAKWARDHSAALRPAERRVEPAFLGIGLAWWLLGGVVETLRAAGSVDPQPFVVAFLSLTAGVCVAVGLRLAWTNMRRASFFLLPALYLTALTAWLFGASWIGSALALLAWILALGVHYATLRFAEDDISVGLRGGLHAGAPWLLAALCVRDTIHVAARLAPDGTVWPELVLLLVPILLAFVITQACRSVDWPFREHGRSYLGLGLAPVVCVAWGWSLQLSLHSAANPAPLSYLPLLNPLDVALVSAAALAAIWYRAVRPVADPAIAALMRWGMALSAFVWLTATLARTVHYWAGVGFDAASLFGSAVFQTAATITWTVLAVGVMVFAARRQSRQVWFAAACLLGVVVLKLFAVDLAGVGTIARIVSFIGTGLLLLLVGYFAPIPPRRPEPEEAPAPA
ncbi:MAG TPA: DUF2339 domain-containing protein [Rhodothermales bacterium]|nr:DUF2339 domain-containing protein [Rhodothermales bacterium]